MSLQKPLDHKISVEFQGPVSRARIFEVICDSVGFCVGEVHIELAAKSLSQLRIKSLKEWILLFGGLIRLQSAIAPSVVVFAYSLSVSGEFIFISLAFSLQSRSLPFLDCFEMPQSVCLRVSRLSSHPGGYSL